MLTPLASENENQALSTKNIFSRGNPAPSFFRPNAMGLAGSFANDEFHLSHQKTQQPSVLKICCANLSAHSFYVRTHTIYSYAST